MRFRDILLTSARYTSSSAVVYGTSATTWSTTPSVSYHPGAQAGTVTKSGSRIVACPDLQGLAALDGYAADGTTVAGPTEMTDNYGRKFWRFNGTEYAKISNALTSMQNRGIMCLMVGRVHHARSSCVMIAPRYALYVSDAANTTASAVFGMLKTTVTSSSAGFLQGSSPAPSTVPSDAYKTIAGVNLTVLAVRQGATADGGNRVYNNNDVCATAQSTTLVPAVASGLVYSGAVVGASAGTSNTAGVTTNVNNVFDLYELAIWNAVVSTANADANVAAAVTNWGITQLDSQLAVMGDSQMDGIATTLATSPAWTGNAVSQMTDPGAGLIPANVRVLNLGTSGGQTSNAVTIRDATNGPLTQVFPGGATKNKVAFMYGRNDCIESQGQKNSATLYADYVALINTTTTGLLQRGWSVNVMANTALSGTAVTTNVSPAGENTVQKRIEGLRALIAVEASHTVNTTFLTDTLTNTGQTYAGLLDVLHLYEIDDGGNKWFYNVITTSDWANATPTGPYDSDGTHFTKEGFTLIATGASTPQYGMGSLM